MRSVFRKDGLAVLAAVAAYGLASAPLIAVAPANAAEGAWKSVPLAEWPAKSAADVLELAAPAMRGFPETLEGRPAATIEMARSKAGDSLELLVSKSGLLDDAVGAEQYRLEIVASEGAWKVRRVAKRWQCRRGTNAGQWTADICP